MSEQASPISKLYHCVYALYDHLVICTTYWRKCIDAAMGHWAQDGWTTARLTFLRTTFNRSKLKILLISLGLSTPGSLAIMICGDVSLLANYDLLFKGLSTTNVLGRPALLIGKMTWLNKRVWMPRVYLRTYPPLFGSMS